MERHPTPNMDETADVLGKRAEAVVVDGILVGVLVGAIGFLLGAITLDDPVLGGFVAAYLATTFLTPVALIAYQTALEGYYGQTLGKRRAGIVVVKRDGSSLTWSRAVLRNLLRIVDQLPAFYLIGVGVAKLTDDSRRLGDIAGGTVVVHT